MNKPAYITTSWDDGHPLDLRLADLLERYGVHGTFYIPRHCQTPTLSESEVRQLSQRFEIGAHTLDHVFLNSANDSVAARQIRGSKAWVEEVTGKPCSMFCPPGGKFASRDLELVRSAGFTGMRTVELLSIQPPKQINHIQVMPTTLQAHPHSLSSYAKNVVKRGAGRNFWLYLRHGRVLDWPTLAHRLLHATLRRGGVFHLWGHSWEIEQTGQWAQLERVLKMMSEVATQAFGLTNGEISRAAPGAPDAKPKTVSGNADDAEENQPATT